MAAAKEVFDDEEISMTIPEVTEVEYWCPFLGEGCRIVRVIPLKTSEDIKI